MEQNVGQLERRMRGNSAQLKWWTRGKTRLDHVRNVHIWKEAHTCRGLPDGRIPQREEVDMVWIFA